MNSHTHTDSNLIESVVELLKTEHWDGLGKLIELLINTAMQVERQEYLKASPYERCVDRVSHANGYKPKTVKTRVGELKLQVPQTRDGFYPESLEKGLRSERALKLALAQMYLSGTSTRRVAAITQELCGFEVTSEQVSRATKMLDEQLNAWRERKLGSYRYIYLDARYEKCRENNQVLDVAVLIAKGINQQGQREIIGLSVSLSEAEVHWREFLQSLINRGLSGVELIVSDSHSGLKAARASVFPSVPWQRCQFHLQQNAQGYAQRKDDKPKIASAIRSIFNAEDIEQAKSLLKAKINAYEASNPRLSRWLEDNIPEGLTVFQIPEALRRKLRTTNPLERVNKEIKRRTRVVGIFPNTDACLRLASALLMEISEDWQSGKAYIDQELLR